MQFVNKGAPPKGGRYYVCSAAAREDKCDNKRLWNAKEVEGHLLHQIDPKRVSEAFDPPAKRTGPSPLEQCNLQIADLVARKQRAFDLLIDNEDSVMAPDLKRRVESLIGQIEDKQKLRETLAKAERDRPHLPDTQAAIASVASLIAKLGEATDKDRTALRVGLIQQMRAAFFQVVFRPRAIVCLIELPEKPKSMKDGFGLPKPIEVRVIDDVERYFLWHVFWREDPEELAAYGGGKGVAFPRFT
jgi:hypothetical protein